MEHLGKELSIEEIKMRLLTILLEFTNFCDRNGIKYYLGYGTALGAVRHHGFIPWDDDVDVMMPREDYYFLQKNWVDERYVLFSQERRDDHQNYFSKIVDKNTYVEYKYGINNNEMGLFIDIFPMDEVYLSKTQMCFYTYKAYYLIRMANLSIFQQFKPSRLFLFNIFKKPIYTYARYRGIRYWAKKIRNNAKNASMKKHTNNAQYFFSIMILDKSIFGEGIMVDFEGYKMRCPKKYDKYLTALYGNYNEIPPEEKRVTDHSYKAYGY